MVSTFYIIFVSDRLHRPISVQRYGKSAVWQNNLPKIQIIITST